MSKAAQSFLHKLVVRFVVRPVVRAMPLSVVPLSFAISQPSAIAQTSEFTTVCAYDPTTGIPNPLGMRTFVSIREVEGNSIFRYQQLPSIVSGTGVPTTPPTNIESERTLTLFETPIAEARQLVVDNPGYYAALLGVSVEDVGEGFAEVNDVLACQDISGNIAGTPTPSTPAPSTPAPSTPAPGTPAAPTLADLPNGNYRMASAEFTNRVVSDEELLAAGGYLFTFRKFDDAITGNLGHIDHERGACVAGTVSGNTITGDAYTANSPTTIDGKTYLDPLGILLLGDPANSQGKYTNSVMTVEGLFQINAGSRIPTESCP